MECWGIRYCYSGLLLRQSAKESDRIMQRTILKDIKKLNANGNQCFIMDNEGECREMGFFYIMFFDKKQRDCFYKKHTTNEKLKKYAKQAHMKRIKEPALIPEEWFGKELYAEA